MMALACGNPVNICSLPQELLIKIFDYLPTTVYRVDPSAGPLGRPTILLAHDRPHEWTLQERLPALQRCLFTSILSDPNDIRISCRKIPRSILHSYEFSCISATMLQISYRLTQAAREVFLRNNYFLFEIYYSGTTIDPTRQDFSKAPIDKMKNLIVYLDEVSTFAYHLNHSDVETAIRVFTSLVERIAITDSIRPLCVIKIQHRDGTFMLRESFVGALSKLTKFEIVVVKLSEYNPGDDNFPIYAGFGPSPCDRDDVGPFDPRYTELKQSLAATLGPSVRIFGLQGWYCMTFRPQAFVEGNATRIDR